MHKTGKLIIAGIATLAFIAPVVAAASATRAVPGMKYHSAPAAKYQGALTVLADASVRDMKYHS